MVRIATGAAAAMIAAVAVAAPADADKWSLNGAYTATSNGE